jgi:hypothetical protein
VARAGVTRSRGQVIQARSQLLPQVSGNLSYSRTLASQFSGFGGGAAAGDSAGGGGWWRWRRRWRRESLVPAAHGAVPAQPLAPHRAAAGLAGAGVPLPAGGQPFAGLSSAGFGSENTWNYGISAQYNAFNGGAVQARTRIAQAARSVAEVTLATQRAQLALDVTQAYFDAGLANQLGGHRRGHAGAGGDHAAADAAGAAGGEPAGVRPAARPGVARQPAARGHPAPRPARPGVPASQAAPRPPGGPAAHPDHAADGRAAGFGGALRQQRETCWATPAPRCAPPCGRRRRRYGCRKSSGGSRARPRSPPWR